MESGIHFHACLDCIRRVRGRSLFAAEKKTVQNRLHIGHPCLTHSFLLKKKEKEKEEPLVCVACNSTITVKLILGESADLLEVRKKYFEECQLVN